MSETQSPVVLKAKCGRCGGERNCEVRAHWKESGSDDFMHWSTDWYILECRGCEYVFAHTVSSDSESYSDYYDHKGDHQQDYILTTKYWPALMKRSRPEWMKDGGIDAPDVHALDAALLELYAALENDLHVLAGIGIRTSFDIASELLGVDTELSFREKLDALVSKAHIGAVDRERLKALVDAGSASAHRGWKPDNRDINTMMDVLEHFIAHAFVEPHRRKLLDEKIGKLKVPARKKRTPGAEKGQQNPPEPLI